MANIDVEKLKEKLYPTASALFCISEVCVDVSKQHISAEKAIEKIRDYLRKTGMYSRYSVDNLIENCTVEEFAYDDLAEIAQEYLRELNYPIQQYNLDMSSSCDKCSNNPKNGGSGICNCTIPYFENPIMYSTGDPCMANNINGNVLYFSTDTDKLRECSADYNRIATAIENTKKYEKRT